MNDELSNLLLIHHSLLPITDYWGAISLGEGWLLASAILA